MKIVILLLTLFIIPNIILCIFITPSVKNKFTDSQTAKICEVLEFVLASDEKIRVEYQVGFLQANSILDIYIDNVSSEEDFLSRFNGEKEESYDFEYYIGLSSGEIKKDEFADRLMLYQIDGKIKARFMIQRFYENEKFMEIRGWVFKPYLFFINPYFYLVILYNPTLVVLLFAQILCIIYSKNKEKSKKWKQSKQQEN